MTAVPMSRRGVVATVVVAATVWWTVWWSTPIPEVGAAVAVAPTPAPPGPRGRPPITKVLVTGASGRTGRLVLELLHNDPRFVSPKALVRTRASAQKLRKAIPTLGLDQIVVSDVTTLTENLATTTLAGLQGYDALILCTSAVPRVSKWSIVKAVLRAPVNVLQRKKALDFRALQFQWQAQQTPETVDYHGALAQFQLAKQLGMTHVVVVGSMGGCDSSNFLNKIGKRFRKDGSEIPGYDGDILVWKRRAEKYLVQQLAADDLDYTIIHPGGLVDTPPSASAASADGSHSGDEFLLDVNDQLLRPAPAPRSIRRADVARLCVAALTVGRGHKVVLDCVTRSRDDAAAATGASVTAEDALAHFLKQGKVYDYEIGV